MAAKAPAIKGETGFMDPLRGMFFDVDANGGLSAADVISTIANRKGGREGLKVGIWYFADIDDGDTWDGTSTDTNGAVLAPPKKPVACYWRGDDISGDQANAYVSTVSGPTGDATITFQTAAANKAGWLLVFFHD
jgi:hypothetical protein